jgi:hypothetical protein
VALNAGTEAARLSVDLADVSGRSLEAVPLPGWGFSGVNGTDAGRAEMDLPARAGGVWRLA